MHASIDSREARDTRPSEKKAPSRGLIARAIIVHGRLIQGPLRSGKAREDRSVDRDRTSDGRRESLVECTPALLRSLADAVEDVGV